MRVGVPRDIIMSEDMRQLFDSTKINEPFLGLHTEYLQKRFMEDNFNLVVCLDHNYSWQFNNSLSH